MNNNNKQESASDYFVSELNGNILDYRWRRDYYRKYSDRFKLLIICTSSVTTFLIGLNGIFQEYWISIHSLISSCLLTALTIWTGYSNYHQRWVQTNAALMLLYKLRSDHQFELAIYGEISQEKNKKYYDELINILTSANASWEKIHAESIKAESKSKQ